MNSMQTSSLLQAAQIQALEQVKATLSNGTRMHIVGQVIIITLSGPDLKPGVPDAPPDADINAAIRHLLALKTTINAARAKAARQPEASHHIQPYKPFEAD